MREAVIVKNVSKVFRILKTTYLKEGVPRYSKLLNYFLGYTFNPTVQRREIECIKALDNVSFDVRDGEIFGIYGKNGAGKTTLLSILGTIYPMDEGFIKIFDYDYSNDVDKIREIVIPLFGWLRDISLELTARQNIEQNLLYYNIKPYDVKQEMEEVANIFEIGDRLDDRLERFSSGMIIKVSIIPALILAKIYEKALVLCDEPFIGLDAFSMKQIRDFFIKFIKRNYAVILATHQASELEILCDRIAVMDKGRILTIDTTENLKKRIQQEEKIRIEITKPCNVKEEDFLKLDEVKTCRISTLNGCDQGSIFNTYRHPQVGGVVELTTSDSRTTIPKVIDKIYSQGSKIIYLKVYEPSLEDVLMNIINRSSRGEEVGRY